MVARKRVLGLLVVGALVMSDAGAAAGSGFTGAWTGTDPDDGSKLMVLIGAESPKGVVRVTGVDQFASACGAPATLIGSGSISGSVLTAVVDVRCGGEVFASDVPVEYELSGDKLLSGGVEFRRPGGG
jgi:hypothetical protein